MALTLIRPTAGRVMNTKKGSHFWEPQTDDKPKPKGIRKDLTE